MTRSIIFDITWNTTITHNKNDSSRQYYQSTNQYDSPPTPEYGRFCTQPGHMVDRVASHMRVVSELERARLFNIQDWIQIHYI
jgi:hypothetical protein